MTTGNILFLSEVFASNNSAGTIQLDRSCWLRLLPQELRCSLVTGLQSARASLSPRLAKESATPSFSSQLNRSGSALLHRNADRPEIQRRGSVVTRWSDNLHLSSAQLVSKKPLVLVVVIRRRHRDSQFQPVGSGHFLVSDST